MSCSRTPATIYIVGTQMNDIVETVHLITQNVSFGLTKSKLSNFYAQNFGLIGTITKKAVSLSL